MSESVHLQQYTRTPTLRTAYAPHSLRFAQLTLCIVPHHIRFTPRCRTQSVRISPHSAECSKGEHVFFLHIRPVVHNLDDSVLTVVEVLTGVTRNVKVVKTATHGSGAMGQRRIWCFRCYGGEG